MIRHLLFLALAGIASAQSTGDFFHQFKTSGGRGESYFTPVASSFWGFDESGVFTLIPTEDYAPIIHTHAFSDLTSKPTTVAGYGITDAMSSSGTLALGGFGSITGTLPVVNGGTGMNAFGTGVATALGQNVSGSGSLVLTSSPTLTTPTFSGAMTLPDNVRQTFNPGTNAAGFNVGSLAGDPNTLSNGDLWYDSTANELTARINGANVALGSGGGGGGNITIGSTTISPGGSSLSLAGLTTLSQTGLHTLTSTSNTIATVPRLLLENLQAAVADTESGLADWQQRSPSLNFKANYWNGTSSVAREMGVCLLASSKPKLLIGGSSDNDCYLSLDENTLTFATNVAGSAAFSLGLSSGGFSYSVATSNADDWAVICGQAMRINLGNQNVEFNRLNVGTATFSGASTFAQAVTLSSTLTSNGAVTLNSTATLNGLATFEAGLTTGTGDDITGKGAITSNSSSEGIGYATGAGGTVTQATSRSTGVTLNTVTGLITCNNASLAAGAEASFVVTNSSVAATDTVIVNVQSSSTGTPVAFVTAVAAGSFTITLSNLHASTADTTADTIRFTVIKSVSN